MPTATGPSGAPGPPPTRHRRSLTCAGRIIDPAGRLPADAAGHRVWSYDKRSDATEDGTVDYYLGGRTLGWFVLVFTLLASAASAGTFIGGPGPGLPGGYGWVLVSIFQVPTAFVALALLGKKFAILSRKLDLVTVTDFLRHRYEHPAVVIVASVGVVVFLVAYMVPQFVGGARVLQAVTGVDYNTLLIIFAGVVLSTPPSAGSSRTRSATPCRASSCCSVAWCCGSSCWSALGRARARQRRGDRASTPSCSRCPGPVASRRR